MQLAVLVHLGRAGSVLVEPAEGGGGGLLNIESGGLLAVGGRRILLHVELLEGGLDGKMHKVVHVARRRVYCACDY